MPISTSDDVATAKSAYDFVVYDAKKKEYDMSQRRGHPTLISNIAMKCGLAANAMACLTKIYHTFKEQDVLVLGFPSSEFNNQNPGTEEETIKEACTRFKSDFPVMKKIEVNGDNASPLYQWMKKARPGFLGTESIKWNFTFFLLDQDGQVFERFGPGPSYEGVEKAVIAVLKKGGANGGSGSGAPRYTGVDSRESMKEIEVNQQGEQGHEVNSTSSFDDHDAERSLLFQDQHQEQSDTKLEPKPKEKSSSCCCCCC